MEHPSRWSANDEQKSRSNVILREPRRNKWAESGLLVRSGSWPLELAAAGRCETIKG